MKNKLFSIILVIFVLVSVFCPAVYAYEPTGIEIGARNAMLISMDTGQILYTKGPIGKDDSDVESAKVYPASITKIMTAILMFESEKFNPDNKIAMTAEVLKLISGTGSAVSNLKAGEIITERDLAYYVLMSSSGDCAYLAAMHYAGSIENFVDLMNKKAKDLGLKGTHYANPIGLHDEQNYTTVWDTYILTEYALKNKLFKEICESKRYTVKATNMSPEKTLSTTNFLQDSNTNYYYTYAKGVKTGFTDEAGRCLVSTASYNGYNYMCILFGCPVDRTKRHEFVYSKDLYRWAFNTFEFKNIADTSTPLCEVTVNNSLDRDFVPVYVENSFVTVMPVEADESTLEIKKEFSKESYDAPIKKGDILGTATFSYAGEVIGKVNLVAGEDVEQSTLLYLTGKVKTFFSSSYMKIVYIFIAVIIVGFIVAIIIMNIKPKKRKVKYLPYDKRKEEKKHYDNY